MIATIWQKQRTQCMLYKWLWSYENSKNLIWVAISAFQKTALEMLRAQLESMVSFTFFCSCVHYTTNNALLSCHENCCCYFCNQIVWEFSHNSLFSNYRVVVLLKFSWEFSDASIYWRNFRVNHYSPWAVTWSENLSTNFRRHTHNRICKECLTLFSINIYAHAHLKELRIFFQYFDPFYA